MFVDPTPAAVTKPEVEFTVATDVLPLLQLPPEFPLLEKVVVTPMHSGLLPETVPALAFGLTVNGADALTGLLQPVVTV